MRKFLALATAMALSTTAQAANLVVNGGFEDGINPNGITTLATDDATSLTGWLVLTSGVGYADSSVWSPAGGSRSVELGTDAGKGGIFQVVTGFTAGSRYRVTFDLSADPAYDAARPVDRRLFTSISGSEAKMFTYSLTDANTASNMLWETHSYDFRATNTFQWLRFSGTMNDSFNTVIDNVSISVVPESTTWMMMIAGFGMVGFAARRNRQNAVAA